MPYQYMKKYRWVIIILLIAASAIIIWLSTKATPNNEREFQGIFIQQTGDVTGGHIHQASQESRNI